MNITARPRLSRPRRALSACLSLLLAAVAVSTALITAPPAAAADNIQSDTFVMARAYPAKDLTRTLPHGVKSCPDGWTDSGRRLRGGNAQSKIQVQCTRTAPGKIVFWAYDRDGGGGFALLPNAIASQRRLVAVNPGRTKFVMKLVDAPADIRPGEMDLTGTLPKGGIITIQGFCSDTPSWLTIGRIPGQNPVRVKGTGQPIWDTRICPT